MKRRAALRERLVRERSASPLFDGERFARDMESLLAELSRISDYGTRRRFSRDWHDEIIAAFKREIPERFAGTSNVWLARKHGVTPLGTMAHEYLQACQALGPRLRDSQVFGFETWAREYRGDLGIALSDVYGIEPFLRDFDMYFCKLFDGARHDSGDPFNWGERMIEHYRQNRVDPLTKTLIFSDSLTIPRTIELYQLLSDPEAPTSPRLPPVCRRTRVTSK